jgi:hypothetical protein
MDDHVKMIACRFLKSVLNTEKKRLLLTSTLLFILIVFSILKINKIIFYSFLPFFKNITYFQNSYLLTTFSMVNLNMSSFSTFLLKKRNREKNLRKCKYPIKEFSFKKMLKIQPKLHYGTADSKRLDRLQDFFAENI